LPGQTQSLRKPQCIYIKFTTGLPSQASLWKNKYVMIYDGSKWICNDREDQINSLLDENLLE